MPSNYESVQDQKQNESANPSSQTPTTGAGPAATSGTSRVASYSSGVQPTQTGSGRFTNLQNYIGANQGASDRLASGISSNLDRTNANTKKDADTQASNVRDGIQAAQGKLETGNNYLNQVKGPNFDANSIADDANKLQDFTGYRTNTAVGADQLATQANQAQTTTQNLQTQLQDQMKNASTEQGRFNLLKNTFGGGNVYQNPYSTGQQRLDQLFLQAGGNDNVNKIQQGIRSNISSANQLANGLTGNVATIGDIGTQASTLASGLQDATTGLTNKYVSDVEATAPAVNAQRAADQKYYTDQYNNLTNGGNVDTRFANTLGLTQGENLYNSLAGQNVNNFFKYGSTQLNGFGQLADTNQEKYYKSLSALAGSNPAYTLDGDPEAAVKFIDHSFDDERAANQALTNDLHGRTAYASGGNSTVLANGSAGVGGIMDQLANNQTLNYGNIVSPNTNAQIAEYLANPGSFGQFTGNTLDGQVKGFVDAVRPDLNGYATVNNAQFNVDQQVNGGVSNAKQNALLAALQQLQDVNYFNRVNIVPSDLESRTGRIS